MDPWYRLRAQLTLILITAPGKEDRISGWSVDFMKDLKLMGDV